MKWQGCSPSCPCRCCPPGLPRSRPGSGWSPAMMAGWCRCTGWPRLHRDAGDEAGRRLAASARRSGCGRVSRAQRPRRAFARWDPVTCGGGIRRPAAGGPAGPVPASAGAEGASKLTPELAAADRGTREAAGATLSEIAAAAGGVDVRRAERAGPGGGPRAGHGGRGRRGQRWPGRGRGASPPPSGAAVPARPDPVPRGWRAGAGPVGAAGRGRRAGVHPGRRVSAGRAAAGAARAGSGRAGCEAARQV